MMFGNWSSAVLYFYMISVSYDHYQVGLKDKVLVAHEKVKLDKDKKKSTKGKKGKDGKEGGAKDKKKGTNKEPLIDKPKK